MEEEILKKIIGKVENNIPVALVTLTEVGGSTPRDAGSMMVVFADGNSFGSIGGGRIELVVIQEAVEALKNQKDVVFSHELTPAGDLHMECGGKVKGYIKILGAKRQLIIAGGGHVGKKVLSLGKFLGFHCVVIDNRSEYREKLKEADKVIIADYDKATAELIIDKNTYIVVATSGHLGDIEFVKTVLKSDCRYLGVVGSLKKHKSINRTLLNAGFSDEEIGKIYGPIGLDISNQLPEEIAMSIMSEILLIKNRGNLRHKKI